MKDHIKTNFKGAYYQRFHHLGTTGGIAHKHAIGIHPVKNFQRGFFEGISPAARAGHRQPRATR